MQVAEVWGSWLWNSHNTFSDVRGAVQASSSRVYARLAPKGGGGQRKRKGKVGGGNDDGDDDAKRVFVQKWKSERVEVVSKLVTMDFSSWRVKVR